MHIALVCLMKSELDRYWQKRDFERTPEPRGAATAAGNERRQFVIQKHDATRLHYDFRLELDGVLKSWAVTKEPRAERGARHLAVETEDHPLEYGTFEGEIPEKQYGAGTVLIWDRGFWTPLGDPVSALRDGKLDFELQGDRLAGRWTLVRNKQRGTRKRQNQWFLIKRSDPAPAAEDAGVTAAEIPELATTTGAVRAALPRRLAPQLATLVDTVPDGPGWLHEPKLDGYRLLCRVEDGQVTLLTRRGNDWTERFPALAKATASLRCRSALLDGEAVMFDAQGMSDFQELQAAIGRGDPTIQFVAFDLLYLDGFDLRAAPLTDRKLLLRGLLEGPPPSGAELISYGQHIDGQGAAFYREACRVGMEGIIAKRAADRYREKRTRSWLKIKCTRRQEFVIVGFTKPKGSRVGFGALLLAAREKAAAPLRYTGKVGTGFDDKQLQALRGRLDALRRKSPPLAEVPRGLGAVHWVEPELVAEVAFSEWTNEGVLRHSSFRGLREDKAASEVVIERAAPAERDTKRPAPRVTLTSPDKILFPEAGISKRQLAAYWEQVAPVALEHLRNRPLTLLRCPEGREAACFYQKHVGAGTPEVIARVLAKGDEDPYAMVDGLPAILGLVQIGSLELHVWGSRAEHIEQPDIIVFDLDPSEELGWGVVVEAALDLKARIEALSLVPFARVTGGKGLHVVVPVVPGPTWPSIKRFARALVHEMVRDEPALYTATISKRRRVGKIFIDYLRNGRGATAIAAYSPRARPGAPVALPVEWQSLDAGEAKAPRYGMLDVPALVAGRADPWAGLEAARRPLV
jgi:bifunctional non-homologous end joining protein LigD